LPNSQNEILIVSEKLDFGEKLDERAKAEVVE